MERARYIATRTHKTPPHITHSPTRKLRKLTQHRTPTCETQEQCFFSDAQNICFSLFYFSFRAAPLYLYPAHLFFTLFLFFSVFFQRQKHTVFAVSVSCFISKFDCVSHVGSHEQTNETNKDKRQTNKCGVQCGGASEL